MCKLLPCIMLLLLQGTVFAQATVLKVAALDLSPYISERGEEQGYLYEIALSAFRDAGYELSVQFVPPLRAQKMLDSGECDLILPSSSPLGKGQILSKSLGASSMGTIRFLNVQPSGKGGHGSKPAVKLEEIQTPYTDRTIQLIDMLNQKRVSSIFADKLVAADLIVSKRPHLVGQLEFTSSEEKPFDFRVAFSRKNPAHLKILSAFDAALDRMKADGRYDHILDRYGVRSIPEDPNTLVIGSVSSPDMKLLEELSPVFLKNHPDVKIRWNLLEENLLGKRVFSSIALHENAFDILAVGHNQARLYARKGWIEPLRKPAASYDLEDVLPNVRQDLSLDGRLYALPFYRESSMTYYRRDLFEKHGLKMPDQPSYEDIRKFASKLHDPANGVNGICLRGKSGWGENSMTLTGTVKAFGGRWFDEDWHPLLAENSWQEALSAYVKLLENYGPKDVYKNGFNETLKLFAEGHCAIWIDATVAASYIFDKERSLVSDKAAFTAAPSTDKARGSPAWNWTWAFAVSTMSKKKALAQEFMEWATSKDYINLVAAKKGWLLVPPGTRLSTYKNPNYQRAAPFSDFVFRTISHGKSPSHIQNEAQIVELDIPEFPALGNVLGDMMSDVFKGKRNVAEALLLSQREVRRIMYHSGYYKERISGR